MCFACVNGVLTCALSLFCLMFFCFKQKTASELRISDWSSYVCSSDLPAAPGASRPARSRDRQRHLGPGDRAARRRGGLLRDQGGAAQLYAGEDRKSVVAGKSV